MKRSISSASRSFRAWVKVLIIVIAIFSLSYLFRNGSAYASATQLGVEQVTLNPGGGALEDGSDGLRFTVNSAEDYTFSPAYNYAINGQDGLAYRGTYQYCCSAGGPMLNIGGTLYGQSGPAYSSNSWSSIEIISTSGVTATGARTSATGNSGAVFRYTVTIGELTYTIQRTLSYTYPNDFVTDSYVFTIPDGNTEIVKFYLGGDTAPGSSDSGYGVMLTEPVRAVISLNTSSHIMFGFREVSGSKPFDGATSQHYYTPFATVAAGGDIGFIGTTSFHDAGLMMQWNLGSTPGVQNASLQQFATYQGTNLNAAFLANTANVDEPVQLSISIVNTELAQVTGLGYLMTLPSGLVIASGTPTSTCNGTLTANAGGNTISLSGGIVESAANCVVTVPVIAHSTGAYTISSANISDLSVLTNNVGTSTLTVVVGEDDDGDGVSNAIEEAAPNSGDGNDDGTADSEQSNVSSLTNPSTGEYMTLEVDASCSLSEVESVNELNGQADGEGFTYPFGLMSFIANCGTPGFTTNVKQYYYNATAGDYTLRKFKNGAYVTMPGAEISEQIIDDMQVLVVSYQLTDGGAFDDDGIADGVIIDPAGPGMFNALAETGMSLPLTLMIILCLGSLSVLSISEVADKKRVKTKTS